jgi:hypothetical protein
MFVNCNEMIRADGDRADGCKRLSPMLVCDGLANSPERLEHPYNAKLIAQHTVSLVPRERSLLSFFLSHMVSA